MTEADREKRNKLLKHGDKVLFQGYFWIVIGRPKSGWPFTAITRSGRVKQARKLLPIDDFEIIKKKEKSFVLKL